MISVSKQHVLVHPDKPINYTFHPHAPSDTVRVIHCSYNRRFVYVLDIDQARQLYKRLRDNKGFIEEGR